MRDAGKYCLGVNACMHACKVGLVPGHERGRVERPSKDEMRSRKDGIYNETQKVPPSQLARLRLLSLALRDSCRS